MFLGLGYTIPEADYFWRISRRKRMEPREANLFLLSLLFYDTNLISDFGN